MGSGNMIVAIIGLLPALMTFALMTWLKGRVRIVGLVLFFSVSLAAFWLSFSCHPGVGKSCLAEHTAGYFGTLTASSGAIGILLSRLLRYFRPPAQ